MGTPMAFTSGTTYTYTDKMFKRGTIGLNLPATLAPGYNWFNGVDVTSSQYLIYSDTYTTGIATQANSIPTAWTTPDKTDASLLGLINTLPERVGQIPFTNVTDATTWLQESNRYFLINGGYENIVTDQLLINVDANWYNSYKTGDTTWYDISGNFNNATLTNSPSFDTKNGGSVVFDGADDYGNFGNLSYNRNNFSVFAWFQYPTIHQSWDSAIVSKWYTGGSNGSGNEWFFGADAQVGPSPFAVTVQYDAGSSNYLAIVGGPIYSANTWYHVGFTWTGGTLSLYVNGVMVASGYTANSSAQTTTQPLTIATFYNLTSYKTNVKIGNFLMYNKALSQAEILKNYNTQKGRYGYDNIVSTGLKLNLNSQIPLSYTGGGNSWYDLSGNNNTGTLTNGPTFDSTTRSIVFDGTDDYVIINDSETLTNTTNLSISVLVKFDDVSRINDIIGKGSGSSPDSNEEYTIVQFGNNIYFDVGNNGGPYIQPSYTFVNNIWYYITCTHERIGNVSNLKLYINGVNVPATVQGATNTPNNNNYPVTLGRRAYDGQPYGNRTLDGAISTAQIYTRTISQSEIIQNYYQGNIVTNGLVLALDAGNLVSYGGTGTTWYNLSGSSYDGTLTNGTSYSTLNGGSLVFDGSDDYVEGSDLGNLSEFTVDCWFYPTSNPNNSAAIISNVYPGTTSKLNFVIGWGNSEVSSNTFFGGFYDSGWVKTQGIPATLNTWWNLTLTFSNGELKFYSSGSLYSTTNTNKIPGSSEGGYRVGRRWDLADYFVGRISTVKVYNRALSAMEVQQNFNAHRGRYGI